MAIFLTVNDLLVFSPDMDPVKAQQMIDDATALAVLAAPCVAAAGFMNLAAMKAILRGAILRWEDAGAGVISSQTTGPFGQTLDTRQARKGMFWPSEIVQLQSLCASGSSYTVSMAGPDPVVGSTGWA